MILALGVSGCERVKTEGDASHLQAPPKPVSAPARAELPPRDVPVALTANPDGTVHLRYVDRWGATTEATYESVDFLKRALPTLERALTAPQFSELQKSVGSLGSVR